MKQKFDDEWRIREGLWEATTKVVNDAYERKSGNWGIVSNLTGAEREIILALIRSGGKDYNELGYSLRHRSGVDDFFEYNAACDELVKRNLIWWSPNTDGYELVTITRDIERERYLQAGFRPGIRFDFKYMAQRGLSFDEALAWMRGNGYEALKRSLKREILTEEIWLRFVDALVEEDNIKEWFTKK